MGYNAFARRKPSSAPYTKFFRGLHAVVAYDYDEQNDNIYCHFGWGSNTTHVTIESMGYDSYNNLFAFKFKNGHKHSDNFEYEKEGKRDSLCVCSTVVPTEITLSENYLDACPVFKWNSLINEKWFRDINLHHEISILKPDRSEAFTIDNVHANEILLLPADWAAVINAADPNYYFYVGLGSDSDSYWDEYYCLKLFKEPNRYFYKASFLPSDWGFIGRYYFSNELDDARLALEPERKNTTVTVNGLTVSTDRLRCGYIENSYVVLSPRRENAGRAYFEMSFDKAVYSFMYRACMWSASEGLDGLAVIQTKDANGTWTTLKDIPVSSLKTKANGSTMFVEKTSSGIYGLRFETTATATGDRNKGRLCIDDIVFSTKSGFLNNLYANCEYRTGN